MKKFILLLILALIIILACKKDVTHPGLPGTDSNYFGQWSNSFPQDPNFFPIAVWLQSPGNALNFKNIGINTYVGLWEGPTEIQLSSLAQQGIYVVASQNTIGLSSSNKGCIKSWMHNDEPDNAQSDGNGGYGACVAPSVLLKLYNTWKQNDPNRPVLLNFGQGVSNMGSDGQGWYGRWYLTNVGGKDYSVASGNYSLYYTEASQAADIISFDIYPVTSSDAWVAGKLEYVPQGVENLVNWTNGQKRVWNCIETTHINSATKRPTPAQVKSEVWMSIIAGSQGIIYFVHEWQPSFREDGIFRYQDVVDALTAINRQITSLAPVINSPTVKSGVQVTSSSSNVAIKQMVKKYNNQTYIFAVSMKNENTTGTFTLNNVSGTVEAVGENRTINISNNQFSDAFIGYAVHIYKF